MTFVGEDKFVPFMFIGHQKNNPNPFPNTMNALLTTKNDHERIPNGERPLTFLFLRRSGGQNICKL